jgi:hypothetical protein
MKKLLSMMAIISMPLVMSTVLQSDARFNDLEMRQQVETKVLNDQMNKKYEAILTKKDLLERSGEYGNATKLVYERYRKEPHAGPHTIERELESLRERFSPGLNAGLKNYNDELALGREKIANKYAQLRKSVGR